MNPKINTKNWHSIDDASSGLYATLIGLQSKSVFPNFILIKNKGESPPGCSRSSVSLLMLQPDLNRTACKGNKIKNKEEIKYKKAKTNFIF